MSGLLAVGGRLERARVRQLRNLTDAARVTRPTATSDGRGGTTKTWESVDVDVPEWAPPALWPESLHGMIPVRLASPTMGELEEAAERFAVKPLWTLTAPHDAGVQVGDRLELGDRTVAIVGVYSDGASWATCERLAAGVAP